MFGGPLERFVLRFRAYVRARCDFGAAFGARRAFLGSILVRCLFGIDFASWCVDVGVDHSQRATRSLKIGEDLGGIEPETFRIWGLGPGA